MLESPLASGCSRASSRSASSVSPSCPARCAGRSGSRGRWSARRTTRARPSAVRYGRVARDSIEALGATPKGYRIGSLAGLDGAELDVSTIGSNGYDEPGATLTANVVLWARPETIVISRGAFDRLAPAQREILRRAGREALAPMLARIEGEQKEDLEIVCGRGSLALATASPSELAALRAAVQPVYDELERDPQTRERIAEIRGLRTGRPARDRRSAPRRLGPPRSSRASGKRA